MRTKALYSLVAVSVLLAAAFLGGILWLGYSSAQAVLFEPAKAERLMLSHLEETGIQPEHFEFRDSGRGKWWAVAIYNDGQSRYDISVEKKNGDLEIVRAGASANEQKRYMP